MYLNYTIPTIREPEEYIENSPSGNRFSILSENDSENTLGSARLPVDFCENGSISYL